MNKAILIGRLTADPEIKTVGSGTSLVTFNIAVDRRFKNQQGERETDFIRCVAWRQTAENIAKFFTKGEKIGIVGEIQTRNFEGDDGKRVYITEINVSEFYFIESKGSRQDNQGGQGWTGGGQGDQQRNDFGSGLPFDI